MYGGRQGFKRKASSYKGKRSYYRKKSKYGAGRFGGFLPTTRSSTHSVQSQTSWRNSRGNPNRPQVSITRGPSFMPERLRLPVKWTYSGAISIAAGVGQQISWLGNSITDPGSATASTVPYGFDYWSNLYRLYAVYGSAAQVQFEVSPAGSVALTESMINWAMWPSLDATSYVSDEESAKQAPFSKNGTTAVNSSTVPFGTQLVRSYISTARIFGVPPLRVELDGFFHGSFPSSNPASIWYWNFLINGSTNDVDNTINFHLTTTYYVELYAFNDLASS